MNRLARVVVAVFLLSSCSLFAQGNWTASGGTTSTTDKVAVGTGTPNPAAQLHVFGSIWSNGVSSSVNVSGTVDAALIANAPVSGIAQILLRSGGSESVTIRREANTADLTFFVGNVERMRIRSTGVIGIGTNNPSSSFEIKTTNVTSQFNVANTGTTVGYLSLTATSRDAHSVGFDAVYNSNLWYVSDNTVAWLTKENDTFYLRASTGNTVGSPLVGGVANLVSVDLANGNTTFAGQVTGARITAHYQDVAEWVPAGEEMVPGTVVILDDRKVNEVVPSKSAYDTRVAGVVSASPGILLGKGGEGQAMIATTGRVKVRVDATKHPIRIGDLLVTSDMTGRAMVSEALDLQGRKIHQPGTVVGKALEPLQGGQGEILVLLSLQ